MSTETPSQHAHTLMEAVRESDKSSYSPGEVRNLLQAIAARGGCTDSLCAVDHVRRGDVFIHKLVGGKVRPWIALSNREGIVVAVAISSGDTAPRMIQSQCRLWPGAWIGTTVSLFNAERAGETITRPYTNLDHLREIEAHLANLCGLRPLRRSVGTAK